MPPFASSKIPEETTESTTLLIFYNGSGILRIRRSDGIPSIGAECHFGNIRWRVDSVNDIHEPPQGQNLLSAAAHWISKRLCDNKVVTVEDIDKLVNPYPRYACPVAPPLPKRFLKRVVLILVGQELLGE